MALTSYYRVLSCVRDVDRRSVRRHTTLSWPDCGRRWPARGRHCRYREGGGSIVGTGSEEEGVHKPMWAVFICRRQAVNLYSKKKLLFIVSILPSTGILLFCV